MNGYLARASPSLAGVMHESFGRRVLATGGSPCSLYSLLRFWSATSLPTWQPSSRAARGIGAPCTDGLKNRLLQAAGQGAGPNRPASVGTAKLDHAAVAGDS